MIDVSPKFNTLRYAGARGELFMKSETAEVIRKNEVPKGNVLEVARAAGILAAKRTPEWVVFSHPIPLDWIELHFELQNDRLVVEAEAKSIWKTGVEMEALTAVTGALLNVYDMLKPIDDALRIGSIELINKEGGKNEFADKFDSPLKTAVLVISDSTFAGEREDKSGKIIRDFLRDKSVEVVVYEILPDDKERIAARLKELVDQENMQLIFTTGGSGLGPRDVTPEATRMVIEKEVPGIAEAIRSYGKERTPFAMLSREVVGVRGRSLIINLPGSSKGARESMQALFPGLLHSFPMMWGGKHPEAEKERQERKRREGQ